MSDVGIVVRLPEQVRDAFLDRDYEIHPQFADCENELPLRADRPPGTAHGPRHMRSTDRIASAQPGHHSQRIGRGLPARPPERQLDSSTVPKRHCSAMNERPGLRADHIRRVADREIGTGRCVKRRSCHCSSRTAFNNSRTFRLACAHFFHDPSFTVGKRRFVVEPDPRAEAQEPRAGADHRDLEGGDEFHVSGRVAAEEGPGADEGTPAGAGTA